MSKLGKIINNSLAMIYVENMPQYEMDTAINNGFKHLIFDEKPIISNIQGFKERYEELDDKIIVHYDIVEYDRHKVENQIRELKELLTASDYKVQKNIEFRDAGLELPYDPTDLHNERQPLRDRINELEELLTCVK